jgi:hypothetical protein
VLLSDSPAKWLRYDAQLGSFMQAYDNQENKVINITAVIKIYVFTYYSKTPIYRAPIYRVPRFTGPNPLPPKFSPGSLDHVPKLIIT